MMLAWVFVIAVAIVTWVALPDALRREASEDSNVEQVESIHFHPRLWRQGAIRYQREKPQKILRSVLLSSLRSEERPSSQFSLPNVAHSVTFADIKAAAARIDGLAHRTPVHTSRTFDERFGGRFFLKCENFQRAGAFKFRGAYNALSLLSEDERKNGVLTYSSGNHAQALALAGSLLEVKTTIIMPSDAPKVKLKATRQYGAEVITYDKEEITREELGARISEERGLPIIPPYDHPDIVAGQGTVAKELIEDIGDLDVLLVCCGGGGLLSGSAIAAKHLEPECMVIGVEPTQADDATRSFKTRKLHTVHNPDTVADGARTPSLGEVTFPLVLKYVDDMITASEDAIIAAMHFIWQRMKLIVEPTGALAAAALFDEETGFRPEKNARVGIIISGGNVEIAKAAELFKSRGLE